MNNKSKFRFAILLFGVLSAFISTSCSGDNNGSLPDDPSQGGGALPVKQVSLSRKTAYGNDWIYYSLEKGKEVNVSEETHAENTDWDIAFNRYNVRTNSGASGKGKGGALLTNIKIWQPVRQFLKEHSLSMQPIPLPLPAPDFLLLPWSLLPTKYFVKQSLLPAPSHLHAK